MAAVEHSASLACLRMRVLLLLWVQGITDLSAYPTTTEISGTSPAPLVTPCGEQETACFSEGELAGPGGICVQPLSRGPCPSDQWFVLQPTGAGNFRGVCQPQLCASGLLPFEGSCLGHEEARERLCEAGHVHLDATGTPRCGLFPGWIRSISSVMICTEQPARTTAVSVAHVGCTKNNEGNCEKRVHAITPKIYIEHEE